MDVFIKYFAELLVSNFGTVIRHLISRVPRYLKFSGGGRISVEFRSFHELILNY